jgi:hypothetical protein
MRHGYIVPIRWIYEYGVPGGALTLLVPAEYMYSAASHASCSGGVLVLRDFHKVVKRPGMVDFKWTPG